MQKKNYTGLSKYVNLSDYKYTLPKELIAEWPLKNRSNARLLVYNKGKILHSDFNKLNIHLPENALLVFNDTKVVKARIIFKTNTENYVEIFCIESAKPQLENELAIQQTSTVIWKCMIGNKKKWKTEQILELSKYHSGNPITLKANYKGKSEDSGFYLIQFEWTPKELTFSQVLEIFGNMPLPPYIKRDVSEIDTTSYQTVYAGYEGAVAAPTAGLHFDEKMLNFFQNSGIKFMFLTLHVGAGTFLPVKSENVLQHNMHAEKLIITKENIKYLIKFSECILPIGTTSLRALESLYWFGLKLLKFNYADFNLEQFYPYQFKNENLPDKKIVLNCILNYMNEKNLEKIEGETSIFIMPPYQLKMCNGLITNFHLPSSTLLMLIAAIVGENWKSIYSEAIEQKYRFLSYGDSSLLIP